MPGVLAKIRSLYQSFGQADRHVADYILQNPETAPRSSVETCARAGGVSTSSVSRFVRKLGFADFRDFTLELARETTSTGEYLFREITARDSDEEVVRKVFLVYSRTLEDTHKILRFGDLLEAARAICACRRLVFLGIGGSGIVALDGALRFSSLDLQAEGHVDPSQMLLQAMRVRPGDVAVGISHSGRSAITVASLRIAGARGGITIGISNYPRSPLRDASRYFFCTSFLETKVKVGALSSRIAQLSILDALYLLVGRHKKVWNVARVNALTEKVLRLRPGRAAGRWAGDGNRGTRRKGT